MSLSSKSTCLALVLAMAAPVAMAQSPHAGHHGPTATAPAATSSQAPAPVPASSTGYKSAFEGYRRFADEPMVPWKQANETVARIGGWKAYAQEAQASSSPESGTPSAEPMNQDRGAPAGGGAHKQH